MVLCYLVAAMAFLVAGNQRLLALSLIAVFIFNGKFGKAVYDFIPSNGAQSGAQNGQFGGSGQFGGQTGGQAGGSVVDPTAIISKALLCFHENSVYSSCEESYRLTETGELHVPPEYTEQYCHGPCIKETHLVLNCVGEIMKRFQFYNKATIRDVSDTIKEGCGFGSQRGNFNVEEHIQEGSSNREKITTPIVVGVVLMILVQGLLF